MADAKSTKPKSREFIALVNRQCHFNNTSYDFKVGQRYKLDNKEHIEKLTHFNANVLLETNDSSLLGRLLSKAETDRDRIELVRKYRVDIQSKAAFQKEA